MTDVVDEPSHEGGRDKVIREPAPVLFTTATQRAATGPVRVVTAGAALVGPRDAALRALRIDGVAARLAAADHTLWGPDAEAESRIRLGWLTLPQTSRDLLPRLDCAARRAAGRGPGPRGALRHGRLVPRTRGHLRQRRRTAGRPRHDRSRSGAGRAGRPRPHRRRRVQQVRQHRGDRQPAAHLRRGIHRGRALRRRCRPSIRGGDRPRLGPFGHRRARGLARGVPRRPERRRPLQRPVGVRPGAVGAGRCRRRVRCSTTPRLLCWTSPTTRGNPGLDARRRARRLRRGGTRQGRDRRRRQRPGRLRRLGRAAGRRVDRQGRTRAAAGRRRVVERAGHQAHGNRRHTPGAHRPRRTQHHDRHRPAGRAVPGLGVRRRRRVPGDRRQPVRPARRRVGEDVDPRAAREQRRRAGPARRRPRRRRRSRCTPTTASSPVQPAWRQCCPSSSTACRPTATSP